MNFKTEENKKKWIETSFLILIKACGFPKNKGEQYLLNPQFFPNTYNSKKLEIDNLFQDLSNLLDLNSKKITYEITYDLRDSGNTPYASRGKINEIEISKTDENSFCINISNSLIDTQKKFIYTLLIEFIRIKLVDFKLFEEENNISEHFIFLAGIYFGFGIILFENRSEVGTIRTGFWKKTWRFLSPVLPENIVYSFAFYQKLFPNSNPNWRKILPSDFQKNIEKSFNLYSDFDIEAKLENITISQELIKNVLEVSENNGLTATAKNNIGYRKLKEGLVQESAAYFREAVKDKNNFGYANDNLGYTLILQGNLEEGLNFLKHATTTGNNDKGYSYRNLALYHHRKGDLIEAKKLYELAFDNQNIPIDFLEYHYSKLLFDMNDKENAIKFLETAKDKGEQVAIDKFNQLL
ncbi:MAG: tetratricopeptide repeat protein [Weeksellaceae bacterium]|nr:tetratricopeptide repeat protein [Weeksellaceae bacterium]